MGDQRCSFLSYHSSHIASAPSITLLLVNFHIVKLASLLILLSFGQNLASILLKWKFRDQAEVHNTLNMQQKFVTTNVCCPRCSQSDEAQQYFKHKLYITHAAINQKGMQQIESAANSIKTEQFHVCWMGQQHQRNYNTPKGLIAKTHRHKYHWSPIEISIFICLFIMWLSNKYLHNEKTFEYLVHWFLLQNTEVNLATLLAS